MADCALSNIPTIWCWMKLTNLHISGLQHRLDLSRAEELNDRRPHSLARKRGVFSRMATRSPKFPPWSAITRA